MRKIAIIGSGIAGLVLGNFLREFNVNFKIFETKKEINPHEGYGIQLSTNSIKILNKIGFTIIPIVLLVMQSIILIKINSSIQKKSVLNH